MNIIDELERRNRRFAATDVKDHQPAIPFVPRLQLYIVTCIDPRVDPAQVLGLDLGDAIVARTVGGRVTAAVLADLAWISYLHETKTPDADWFALAVVHHTDCGSGFFADEQLRHDFAGRTGADERQLAALAVLDPAKTVRDDVDLLRQSPWRPPAVPVSGHVYDVRTGLITTVAPPQAPPPRV